MAGTSMRTAEPNNTKPEASPPHSMASAVSSMTGGKKRRTKKAKMSKARRLSRSKSMRRSKSIRRGLAKRGGMGAGFGAVLKEAIVPFGLFAWQKRSQRRRDRK